MVIENNLILKVNSNILLSDIMNILNFLNNDRYIKILNYQSHLINKTISLRILKLILLICIISSI